VYLTISNKAAASPSSTITNVTTAAVVRLKFADLGAEYVCVAFPPVVSAQAVRWIFANETKKNEKRSIKMSSEIADEILDIEIN
jgi:hypothetical protein